MAPVIRIYTTRQNKGIVNPKNAFQNKIIGQGVPWSLRERISMPAFIQEATKIMITPQIIAFYVDTSSASSCSSVTVSSVVDVWIVIATMQVKQIIMAKISIEEIFSLLQTRPSKAVQNGAILRIMTAIPMGISVRQCVYDIKKLAAMFPRKNYSLKVPSFKSA